MSRASEYELKQCERSVENFGDDVHAIQSKNEYIFKKQIQDEHIKKSYDILKEYVDAKIKLEIAKYDYEQKSKINLPPDGTSNAYFVKSL